MEVEMSSETPRAPNARPSGAPGWVAIPAPLARLFKKFPLLTYPPNELPARSPSARDVATLYVFISNEDALRGLPSFNPSCLKWQAFLKLSGIDFRVVSSNNHASPSGALPFLIPPSSANAPSVCTPIASNKLEDYAAQHGTSNVPAAPDFKQETYESFLSYQIRNAWLYALYLSRPNSALLSQLYITPVSASRVVRTTILYQLRHAAETEILKSMGVPAVNSDALYRGAKEAFGALSAVLGSGDWFFGDASPSLFDATVFSYTHLLLDDSLAWEDRALTDIVKRFPNLVQHRDRILQICWGSKT
ncbi:hypothetical protein F4821DRAFT_230165 [Hypoxylon rubiginosum]|uniref:Uncharacterized protein n=1 Tax=Hypoxylon rubiginosum TaxID=110542 RepID=A0ACC0DB01_9PEZI|nr:hypothetical protein F4821DRAFT_230165 [Hypoxylon rubiginosum]